MSQRMISVGSVCLDWRRHLGEREAVQLCRTCLRELVGRLDEVERRLGTIEAHDQERRRLRSTLPHPPSGPQPAS